MFDPHDRGQFLNWAALSEGGLVLAAYALGWLFNIDPFETLVFSWPILAWGLAGTLPLFLVFLLAYRYIGGPFYEIKRFLIEMLGPSLAACRWYDVILLGLLAGFCEELLFRGVIQAGFGRFGFWIGISVTSVLFGLAHCITPTYAILAAAVSVYFGVLPLVTPEGSLLVPMITHGVYDYLAFLVVAATYRREVAEGVLPG